MIIDVDEADTNISTLLEQLASGEEIIIAKAGRPVAKLVPYKRLTEPRVPGALNLSAIPAALSAGAAIGLLISVALLHFKLIPLSFAEGGPLLLQALVGNRNIYVQHLGSDEDKGWVSFDARAEGAARECFVKWQADQSTFTDPCTQETYPADGTGLAQHPVTVSPKGRVSVDLRSAAAP